ncbi:hypothetical protein TNCV_4690411 [Trichonephila clavipes]|nr:hypothetical protein TNCV_4690411 [Trichonephila clavipes]
MNPFPTAFDAMVKIFCSSACVYLERIPDTAVALLPSAALVCLFAGSKITHNSSSNADFGGAADHSHTT